MSIHNLRYSVQLIKIATRNKKNPRFWCFKQLCARHSYVCRHALYVVYIVTQTPSFQPSRDLDKSNKFRQMQELTNDYYSEIKLHNIFHIAYKAIEFSTNKKLPTTTFPIPILERQQGSPCHGGFVHKANTACGMTFYLLQHGGESAAGHCLLVRRWPREVSARQVAARITERQREALVIMNDHHLRRRMLVSTAVARPVVARRPLRAAVGRLGHGVEVDVAEGQVVAMAVLRRCGDTNTYKYQNKGIHIIINKNY